MKLSDNEKRFIAILNKKIELGRLMNALGHMTAGLCANYPDIQELTFLQYVDKDGDTHPNISHFPYIVLQANNSNKIRTVREELKKREIPFTDFTHTMIAGSSADQLQQTKETHEKDMEYFGICFFGKTEEVREFTKKFSLFK